MKDWKGNEIKVGDTVAVRKVTVKFYESGRALERINEELSHVTRSPQGDGLWILLRRYKIVDGMQGTITDDIHELPIAMIDIIAPQPFEILTIEGVSDNKDEYYRVKN